MTTGGSADGKGMPDTQSRVQVLSDGTQGGGKFYPLP